MDDWIDEIVFPEPWIDLRRREDRRYHRAALARHKKELRREIARGHVLFGRRWKIVGLGVPARDDVLLRLDPGLVALVHITWRGAPEPTSWPTTTLVASPEELRHELEDRDSLD